jgi:vacuolar-type H+-ATPase subunit H
MAADTYTSIKDIEAEAENIVEEAKATAKATTEKARAEAREILASEISIGDTSDVEKEIIAQAEEEARRKIEEAEQRAAKLRKSSTEQVEGVINEIVEYMKGVR